MVAIAIQQELGAQWATILGWYHHCGGTHEHTSQHDDRFARAIYEVPGSNDFAD